MLLLPKEGAFQVGMPEEDCGRGGGKVTGEEERVEGRAANQHIWGVLGLFRYRHYSENSVTHSRICRPTTPPCDMGCGHNQEFTAPATTVGHLTTLLPNPKVVSAQWGELTDAERKGKLRQRGKRGGMKHYKSFTTEPTTKVEPQTLTTMPLLKVGWWWRIRQPDSSPVVSDSRYHAPRLHHDILRNSMVSSKGSIERSRR